MQVRDRRELLQPRLLREADDAEVRLVHTQQQRRLRSDRALVIGGARAVRRSHLAQASTGAYEHVRDPEAVADLDQLAAGVDLVCFSGDKLLGGPQAGIVLGRSDLVERLRRHPLQRALRADKLTLAALEGTLALYLDAPQKIPVLRMLRDDVASVRARAKRLAQLVGGEVEETIARAGGGALPLAELPSYACAVEEELAAKLRAADPPVIAVVRDGRTLLDCRTIANTEVDEIAAAISALRT